MSIIQFKNWFESEVAGTAAVIVIQRDKALILQRGKTAGWMPGYWNLPGGSMEAGETPSVSAVRECQEEAGFTPINIKPLSVIHDKDFTLHLFSGETNVTKPTLNFESSAYAWVDMKSINQYQFVPYVKQAISKVLHNARSVALQH